MAIHTILVPTDFSAHSTRALDWACEAAKPFGADIVVVHSSDLPAAVFPETALSFTPEMTTRLHEGAKAALESLVTEYKGRGVSRWIHRVGDAFSEILSAAEQVHADLIVMGTHGRRGLSRALLGSVAERVVRTSHVPVVTIRTPEKAPSLA